jgi:hypothetical protein
VKELVTNGREPSQQFRRGCRAREGRVWNHTHAHRGDTSRPNSVMLGEYSTVHLMCKWRFAEW